VTELFFYQRTPNTTLRHPDAKFLEEVGSRKSGDGASAADDLRAGLWAAFQKLVDQTK
jgi:hypothetical protein